MMTDDQGIQNNTRYTVIPRTLCFILHQQHLLLLEGATNKRLWPGLLNGLGGHLAPNEDPLAAALREVTEESGAVVEKLDLAGIIHISREEECTGVFMLVFVGHATNWTTRPSSEGTLGWYPLGALPYERMVPDLRHLIPHLLDRSPGAPLLMGHYGIDRAGRTRYHFH